MRALAAPDHAVPAHGSGSDTTDGSAEQGGRVVVVVVVVGAAVGPQLGAGGQYLNWTHPVSG